MTPITDTEAWVADWMALSKFAQQMATAWPELVRLATMPSTDVDGFGPGGGSGRRSTGTHADPVAAMVERMDEWPDPERDRTAEMVGLLHARCDEMMDAKRRAEGIRRLIDKRGDARYGRQSSVTDCLCCEATVTGIGEDRIKAGYCPTCHRAWLRYRDAEQAAGRDPVQEMFRRTRRAEMATEAERAS